jgi:hypothetical protein
MWCLYLQTQRDALLKVILRAQDRQQRLARSSHLSPRVPPWEKTAPAARSGAKVSAARGTAVWPAGLPRPPHLVAAPPQAPTAAREAKKRPRAAPGCSRQNQNPNQKPTVNNLGVQIMHCSPWVLGAWTKGRCHEGRVERGPSVLCLAAERLAPGGDSVDGSHEALLGSITASVLCLLCRYPLEGAQLSHISLGLCLIAN